MFGPMAERTEFDEALDRRLYNCGVVHEDRFSKLSVEVYAYNNGKPKIQISRQKLQQQEWVFSKLGRMSAQEFEAVSDAAKIAFEAIDRGEIEHPQDSGPEEQPPW